LIDIDTPRIERKLATSKNGSGGFDLFGQLQDVDSGEFRRTSLRIPILATEPFQASGREELRAQLLIDADRVGKNRSVESPPPVQRADLENQAPEETQAVAQAPRTLLRQQLREATRRLVFGEGLDHLRSASRGAVFGSEC
jgi:hypothetical protein